MTCKESIKWLDSVIKTLGQSQYQSLWNWEQPLTEIKEMLESKRVVELPCKVGDTVYHYCKSVNQIVPYVVEDIHIDKEQTRYFATAFNVYYNEYLDEIEFTKDKIGKTVFLSKSEAEQKLKELLDYN